MAIRLGPPPGLARLRLQWHAARNQFLRQSRVWNEQALPGALIPAPGGSASALPNLSRWSLRERARQRQRARQQAQLAAFTDRYEDMVDLLCWAAKEGANRSSRASTRNARLDAVALWPDAAPPAQFSEHARQRVRSVRVPVRPQKSGRSDQRHERHRKRNADAHRAGRLPGNTGTVARTLIRQQF